MDLTKILHSLGENLLTPIPMCFALGVICKVIHGGIKIPKELYYSISIFLLMSIGFIGGHELAKEVGEHGLTTIWQPALVTLILGCFTPIAAYIVLRYLGRMSVADSAGIAAHYGSTSAVTFAVADAFVNQNGSAPNSYLPTLVTILECPGIAIALALGAVLRPKAADTEAGGLPVDSESHTKQEGNLWEALYEVVTGQSIMLMAGLLVIGFVATNFIAPPQRLLVDGELVAAAQEEVVVLEAHRPVRREAELDAGAHHAAPAGVLDDVGDERAGASNEGSVAVADDGGAALDVEQEVVGGEADLASEQAERIDA
jgi:hypothetical protein